MTDCTHSCAQALPGHLEAIWKPSKPLRRPRCLRPSPRRHPWAPLPGEGRQLRAPARCWLTTSLLGPLALRPDSVSHYVAEEPGNVARLCQHGADAPGSCHRLARLCQRTGFANASDGECRNHPIGRRMPKHTNRVDAFKRHTNIPNIKHGLLFD